MKIIGVENLDEKIKEALSEIKGEEGSKEIMENLLPSLGKLAFDRNFILVYGTLRKKQYNYERIRHVFGKNSLIYIGDTRLDYHRMYDLGNYPAIIPGGSKSIVVELMFCNDDVYKAINEMETSAGYSKDSQVIWVKISNNTLRTAWLNLYTASPKLITTIMKEKDRFPLIESGDWVKYLRATEAPITLFE